MGRNLTVVTPTVGINSYTNTKYYDGVGNIVKVTDLKSQNTEYTYNARNQRTRIRYKGMGSGGTDVDIDFAFNCCRMTFCDDPLGTSDRRPAVPGGDLPAGRRASLYDDFARLTFHTDEAEVPRLEAAAKGYEYDGMNRVTKVTDHTGIDTDYVYEKAGYVAGVFSPGYHRPEGRASRFYRIIPAPGSLLPAS
jgi:YD repeat-containing protein